ncbi:30S ribosome-binding factor RbfA [Vallitalea sediminicola]
MKKRSNRIIKINEEIRKEVSSIINRGLKDPRVNHMTSVVSVDTTPDLKFCKIYVSVLGDKTSQSDTLEGLKCSTGFIRNELAKRINLRNTPEITFVVDQSIEYGVNMSKLIDEVNKPKGE